MIDISREELITLTEAAESLPRRRNGSKPRPTTLYRWAKDGLNGVHLEILMVGSTTCTSLPALQRFLNRVTAAKRSTPVVLSSDRKSLVSKPGD